jgi:hypothetical protein
MPIHSSFAPHPLRPNAKQSTMNSSTAKTTNNGARLSNDGISNPALTFSSKDIDNPKCPNITQSISQLAAATGNAITSTPLTHKYRLSHIFSAGVPRLHESLFLEIDPFTGSGHTFHVTGTVLMGMTYSTRHEPPPSMNPEFVEMKYLGEVNKSDYYEDGEEVPLHQVKGRFTRICESIEVPGKQVDLRGRKLPGVKEVRRCGDWVRDVVEALKREGVLKEKAEEGRVGKRDRW